MFADVGVYDESPPNDSDARPTISLFEQWEEGAHVPRIAQCKRLFFSQVTGDTIYMELCLTSTVTE